MNPRVNNDKQRESYRWKTNIMEDDGENGSSFYKDQFTQLGFIYLKNKRELHPGIYILQEIALLK